MKQLLPTPTNWNGDFQIKMVPFKKSAPTESDTGDEVEYFDVDEEQDGQVMSLDEFLEDIPHEEPRVVSGRGGKKYRCFFKLHFCFDV